MSHNSFFFVRKPAESVDCQWGNWTTSVCSGACGGGTRNKTRTVMVQAEYGGSLCTGNTTMIENCTLTGCPGIAFHREASVK